MAKTAPTPDPAPDAPAVDIPTVEPVLIVDGGPDGPIWGNWRYTGPAGVVYTNIPLTAKPGDVVTFYGSPGQGWEPTDDPANARPDNWRPEPPDPTDLPPAGD